MSEEPRGRTEVRLTARHHGPPPDFQKKLWRNWWMWLFPLLGVVASIFAQNWVAAVWAALCIFHVITITQRELVIDLLWEFIEAKGWSEMRKEERGE